MSETIEAKLARLDEMTLERPVEYNVAVRLKPVAEVTKGGLHIPASVQEMDKHKATRAVIAHVSPLAFNYDDRWPEGTVPKVGDAVLLAQWAGTWHKDGDVEYRFVKDKDVLAVLA
jgi:co-chaperonin GroES (HSP10)